MATIVQNVLTILEQAKRQYHGEVQKIAEILDEINEIFGTMMAREANDKHSHVVTVRAALPTINPRGPNEGAESNVSKVRQIREAMMVLDSFVRIDELILRPEKSREEFVMTEIRAQLEATMQGFGEAFVYGNMADDPRTIDGLATRYGALSLDNVYGAGKSGGDGTSVWMIETGPDAAYLIYPQGSTAGIRRESHEWMTFEDASGNPYRGWEEQVQLGIGLAIADDRAAQRLANIDPAGGTNGLDGTGKVNDLVKMRNNLPRMGRNSNLYVNRTTKAQMDIWALDKANAYFTMDTLQNGSVQTRFQGIPVRVLEQILDTEAQVS